MLQSIKLQSMTDTAAVCEQCSKEGECNEHGAMRPSRAHIPCFWRVWKVAPRQTLQLHPPASGNRTHLLGQCCFWQEYRLFLSILSLTKSVVIELTRIHTGPQLRWEIPIGTNSSSMNSEAERTQRESHTGRLGTSAGMARAGH